MRDIIKRYIGLIYVAVVGLAVFFVVRNASEWSEIRRSLAGANVRWLLVSAGMILAYLMLRAWTVSYYLKHHGWRFGFFQAMGVTGAGQFYSAITPSASGGQPVQVLKMTRRGVPVGVATACVSVEFMGFQCSFLLFGLIGMVVRWNYIAGQIYGWRWLVVVGWVVNAAMVAAIVLAACLPNVLQRIFSLVIRLGEKIRIIRHPEKHIERFRHSIVEYSDALAQLLRYPGQTAVLAASSLLQTALYLAVPIGVYRAFHLYGASVFDLFILSALLFTAAAFLPLPGAAGAQESGFCLFYHGIFPDEQVVAAMLCWRGFSYYLLVLFGVMMMAVDRLTERRR